MPRAGLDPDVVTRAAATIVDTEGLAALTLARLAAVLGVAPPSLYKHVGGLDDLTGRLTVLAMRRLADATAAAAMGRAGGASLLATAQAYRRFAIDHAGLYTLTQAAPEPGSAEQRAEAARAVQIFSAVVTSYDIPDHAVIHAVRLVRAGLHGFADIEARGGFRMAQAVDESFLVLIDALDASLRDLANRSRRSNRREGRTAQPVPV